MNLERMKFAWARSARIEARWADIKGAWIAYFPNDAKAFEYRIHPDDEHLQYGPLSTALRLYAVWGCEGVEPEDPGYQAAVHAAQVLHGHYSSFSRDPIEVRMHMLFFAEYLADQGL